MNKIDQVVQKLAGRCHDGAWQPGDRVPSVREMAEQLGCSNVTVANAYRLLAERGYLSARGQAGTYVAAREQWGTAPAQNPSKLVGVMLGIFHNPQSAPLRGVEAVLSRAGYSSVLSPRCESVAEAMACIEHWRRMGLHGLIWSPLSTRDHAKDNNRLAQAILASGMQAVAVDRYPQAVEVNAVISDNAYAGLQLTRHLIELGHQKIALLRHHYGSTPEDRFRGYRQALEEADLPFHKEWVLAVHHDIAEDALVNQVVNWLKAVRPTAVWSIAGSPLGQALVAAVWRLGWRIPQDLSVASFDSVIAPMQVTAMMQPFQEMGERAAELLLQIINTGTRETHRVVLPSRLIEGQSCASLLKGRTRQRA